jgi:hypothetical protein
MNKKQKRNEKEGTKEGRKMNEVGTCEPLSVRAWDSPTEPVVVELRNGFEMK